MQLHFSVRMDLTSWWNAGDEQSPVGTIMLAVNGKSRELPIRSVSLERSENMKIVLGAGNPEVNTETIDLQLIVQNFSAEPGTLVLTNCALRFRSSAPRQSKSIEDYSFSFSGVDEEGHYASRSALENRIIELRPVSRSVALRNENDVDGNLKISGALQCLYSSPEHTVEISQGQFDLVL
ncbi:MAG: hypothetical protein V1799_12880 [bacterium]